MTDKPQSMNLCWETERMNECWKLYSIDLDAGGFHAPMTKYAHERKKNHVKGFALSILIVEMVDEFWAVHWNKCVVLSYHIMDLLCWSDIFM